MADELGSDWWKNNSSSKPKKNMKRKRDEEIATEDASLATNDMTSTVKMAKMDNDSNHEDSFDIDEPEGKGSQEKRKKHRKKKSKAFDGTVISSPDAMISQVNNYYSETGTDVEKEAIGLSENHFSLCNDGTFTITSFVKSLFPKWKRSMKGNEGQPGKPIIIVVCSSAIRCVELIRQMATFKSDKCTIAKLFAKHMKMKEMKEFLKSKTIHVAVGTPSRIHTLLSSGDISVECVKSIILDVSHKDVKKSTMFDIKIVKSDLMKLLSEFLIPHMKKDCGKMALF